MLLVLDVGNTDLTVGLAHDGAITGARRARTQRATTPDELELLLEGLLALDDLSLNGIGAIACSSVVPAVTSAVEAVARRRNRPLLLASAATLPLAIRVERPSEVGPDRLVNALAASRLYGTPAVVADLGTATSFDAVDREGAFVGGAIAPGLELGLEALAERTARLPRVELRLPDRAIGRDTLAAMQSGTIFGHQALVAGLLERIRRELAESAGIPPRDVRTVLTGGLSVAPWARGIAGVDAIDPQLTLKGLAIFHAETVGSEDAR